MPTAKTRIDERLARRRRRVLGAIGTMVVGWGTLTALPTSAASPEAGAMHTEIVTLSGPDARAVPPAGDGATTTTTTSTAGASGSEAGAAGGSPGAPAQASPGWTAAIDVADGTQAVAASWTDAPAGAVEVRGEADGTWSDWAELESDPDEGPDGGSRNSGGMAWFGIDGVDRVELRVTAGELGDLELQSMRYDDPAGGTAALDGGATTSVAGQPTIQPRSAYTSKGWAYSNPGCSSGPSKASGGVKFAVVHHTVNSNTYAASDVPALLASIYAYHTGTNRWCDVAYNFLVDRFGRIWEGRSGGTGNPIVGGHAQGFNTGSVGVSFLGQYEPGASPTAAAPSTAALTAASNLIGWKLGLYGIDPTGNVTVTSGGSNRWPAGTVLTIPRVIGHRDVGYTACPGQKLYDQLPAVRLKAKAAQGGTTTTTTTTPPPPPVDYSPFSSASALVNQQYQDVLYRAPSSSDLGYWSGRVGDSWPPGQFVAHLASSTEADDRVHAVTRLYRAYFLRNPDHGGFTYWMGRRGNGETLARISSNFAGSSEFRNRYGNLDDAAFVDLVYRNVLDRAPDSGGADYWRRKLAAGTSRGQMMSNFSQSNEYKDQTRAGVLVVGIHEAMLRRAVPGDVYALFTAGIANGSSSVTAFAGYLWDSDSYQGRFG